MRLAVPLFAILALASPSQAQSCYGYPSDFGVYPMAGYASPGEGASTFLAGAAASGLDGGVSLRGLYARTELDRPDGVPDGVDLPSGNGLRLDLAGSPEFTRGRVCLVASFRRDSYGEILDSRFATHQMIVGPSFGTGATSGDVGAHFFVSPQVRFLGGSALGTRTSESLWAVEGGVGLTISRVFARFLATKVEDFDDVQFEVVVGGWAR